MRKRPAGWFETDARHGGCRRCPGWSRRPRRSEHPDYFPAAGAEYIASKLDAIASNEDLWHKTLFILTYDENDGLFDHVPPPVAPRGTPGEYVGGQPIGLGFRVPAVVVSPWSAGGHVCSDVLDHTSLIRVIEKRFGVREPNISAFRRRICGDFTSALRFSGPRPRLPAVAGGHHPGRRRGRAPHRPARGVRQPRPAGPGGQRTGPAAVKMPGSVHLSPRLRGTLGSGGAASGSPG